VSHQHHPLEASLPLFSIAVSPLSPIQPTLQTHAVIVRALKKRKLRSRAPGATGAEGEGDWVVVDCGNWLVHAMDAHSRKCIRLEEHWKRPETCQMPEGRNEQEVEDKLDMLVAANPVPDEYNVDITRCTFVAINFFLASSKAPCFPSFVNF